MTSLASSTNTQWNYETLLRKVPGCRLSVSTERVASFWVSKVAVLQKALRLQSEAFADSEQEARQLALQKMVEDNFGSVFSQDKHKYRDPPAPFARLKTRLRPPAAAMLAYLGYQLGVPLNFENEQDPDTKHYTVTALLRVRGEAMTGQGSDFEHKTAHETACEELLSQITEYQQQKSRCRSEKRRNRKVPLQQANPHAKRKKKKKRTLSCKSQNRGNAN